jgi:hypothetical protein
MTSEHFRCERQRLSGARALAGRWLTLVATAIAAGGCATPPTDGAREYLDAKSAATVTVAARPLVFARERPELAVHARDYLTLVPVDVNRAGTHVLYFYGYSWSTIDKRRLGDVADAEQHFELIADGRRIALTPVKAKPRAIGLAEPPLKAPADTAQVLISATSREVLAFLAGATVIRVVAVQAGMSERYELWADGRAAIAALL